MNHRIKKKIETKISRSMFQFDPYRHEMIPTAKTYHGIKLERKKVHDAIVWLRHVTFQYKGYDSQLKDCRIFRRKYGKVINEKMKKHPVFKPYLIGVDMNESSDKEEQ